MVYDVNVKRIKKQLTYLSECGRVMRKLALQSTDIVDKFAAERAAHLAVECMIDVGSVMIDGFIMRDPGGYMDIVDILEDEKVITPTIAERLKNQVQLRERLVRYYDEVTWDELRPFLNQSDLYFAFIDRVESYLVQELGEDWLA